MKKYIYLLLLCFFVGCGTETTIIKQYKLESYKSNLICNYVKYEHSKTSDPEVEVIKKYKRQDCPFCKGSGVMTQGDGHKVECPNCEITKGMTATIIDKCSPDCICDNCTCSYPGECLVKKNKGWAVQIVNDDGSLGNSYFPLDSDGQPYNPYNSLPSAKRGEYVGYEKPLRIDSNGDLLK